MIKGAPVKTEARTLPGASATTEVQNNILLAASDPADASVVLLCRSSCMILLPLELCLEAHFFLVRTEEAVFPTGERRIEWE